MSSFCSGSSRTTVRCTTILSLVRSQFTRYILPIRVPVRITRPSTVHTARFQENGSIRINMASAIPVHVNISEIWGILGISNSFLSFPPTAFRVWTGCSATDLSRFRGCSLFGCLLSSACRFPSSRRSCSRCFSVAFRFSSRRRISEPLTSSCCSRPERSRMIRCIVCSTTALRLSLSFCSSCFFSFQAVIFSERTSLSSLSSASSACSP